MKKQIEIDWDEACDIAEEHGIETLEDPAWWGCGDPNCCGVAPIYLGYSFITEHDFPMSREDFEKELNKLIKEKNDKQ